MIQALSFDLVHMQQNTENTDYNLNQIDKRDCSEIVHAFLAGKVNDPIKAGKDSALAIKWKLCQIQLYLGGW